jgi:hypothetical protein
MRSNWYRLPHCDARRRGVEYGYHIKPAAALRVPEIGEGLGVALTPRYRVGRWFESTAAHHGLISKMRIAQCW